MRLQEIENVAFDAGSMVLVRSTKVVAFVDESTTAMDAMNEVIGAAMLEDIDSLRSIASQRVARFASFAIMIGDDSGWELYLRGSLVCEVQTATATTHIQAVPNQVHHQSIDGVHSVAVQPAGLGSMAEADATDLPVGAVRANRMFLSFQRGGAPPGQAAPKSADSKPAPPPPSVKLVDLSGRDIPTRPALAVAGIAPAGMNRTVVEVLGVRCPADHHNHPDAVHCANCGRRIDVNQTAVACPGPRPPLGLFFLDDGSIYSIAADIVIGRDPSGHADVVDHAADELRLTDDRSEISRSHLGIYLDDWSVTAIDLDSANGSMYRRHGRKAWMPLPSDSRVVLESGDTIRVGHHELRVELHHVQA